MAGRTWLGVALAISLLPAVGEGNGRGHFWLDARNRKVHADRSVLVDVARRAMPAVVAITTKQAPSIDQVASSGDTEPQKGLGSGFIIHPDGYILTSSHVIEGTTEIKVSLLEHGVEHEYVAQVVGADPETDFALLRIHAGRKLPVLKLGSVKDVRVADWVVVIGNPFGLAHSVTVGVVSYKGRTDVTPAGRTGFFDYLQTDASINPGNSGGPVLDLRGNVVAIANAVNTSGQGIAFAVPIDMAKVVLPDLKEHGGVRRGWMGVTVQDVTPEVANTAGIPSYAGVLVSEVLENSPAAKAGLRVGDVITSLGRSRVHRAYALRWKVATADVGALVKLTVRRDGHEVRVQLRLDEMPGVDGGDDDVLAGKGGAKQGASAAASHAGEGT